MTEQTSPLPEDDRSPGESDRAFAALADRVTESMRLEKLSNRELVFEVAHSEAADDPVVEEMMHRLWPDWSQAECPPNCALCQKEHFRG